MDVNRGPVGEENIQVPRHPGVIGGRVGHQRDSFKQQMQKQLEHFLTMLRSANTIEQQNQIFDLIKSNPALETLMRQQQFQQNQFPAIVDNLMDQVSPEAEMWCAVPNHEQLQP